MELYDKTSFEICRKITHLYSTSFSLATRMFRKEVRDAIYSIYGFVRIADEIVDTFHGYDKKNLLNKFEQDYYEAYRQNICTNPVLHAFQLTVKKYCIPDEHIRAFIKSMRSDLEKNSYSNQSELEEYIYGSADVVGLMCLRVFCHGNETLYQQLKKPAMKLGSAFQKVNFLRDIKNDAEILGRFYFPDLVSNDFNDTIKQKIIGDIESDFAIAYSGIKKLPGRSKLAVLLAYYYYRGLLQKIQNTPPKAIMQSRISVSNARKLSLMIKASVVYKFRLI